MFVPYTFTFFEFILLCFIFFLMWYKSQEQFKREKFIDDCENYKKEFFAFKEAVEDFVKTKQSKSVTMRACALKFAVENNVFGEEYTREFKQILKAYPDEEEFDIEINH